MIPIALIPGLVLPTIALLHFMNALSGKRIAIIGGASTGKTTLGAYLRDRRLPEQATHAAKSVDGKFKLRLGKREVDFVVARDLTGGHGQLVPESKVAFMKADYVVYMFRADRLVTGDPETCAELKTHFDTMKLWLDQDKLSKPKIVLVGTFADRAQQMGLTEREVVDSIATLDVVKLGRVKLGKPELVLGSLVTPKACARLVQDITDALR